jgi:hypothetical protein
VPKVYVEVNEQNEVIGWGTSRGTETELEFEIEPEHLFFVENPFFFKVINGVLTFSDETRKNRRQERRNRREIRELREYLKETDFYFIRKIDEGTAIPDAIKQRRLEARTRLRELGL